MQTATRLEMFSDAVFAIAITLLVLELPFDRVGEGELGHALLDNYPSFGEVVWLFAAPRVGRGVDAQVGEVALARRDQVTTRG